MADVWFVVNHPIWQKPGALVGVQNRKFVGYIPLIDPRDGNGDGVVSSAEWLASKMPILGNLAVEAEKGAILRAIALDKRVLDAELYTEGTRKILAAAMVACKQAISMIYIKRIAGPAAAAALSGTTMTGVSYFFAKKGLETVFKKMIDKALE